MATQSYQGVILAAGHGSRMGPFGERVPKPIAPICNKPLIVYQIESLKSLGITDVIIVIGHLGHRITQTLGDGAAFGVCIRYVEQQERLGLAHAVGQLERLIDRPFVLVLGDIFYQSSRLGQMLSEFEDTGASAIVVAKEETDPDLVRRSCLIMRRDDGTVRRIIEKPTYLPSMLRACGIYLFDQRIFDAIRRTPRTAMRDEYELTDSIQILVDYEYPVRAPELLDWDLNITLIGDLIRCCRRQLAELGQSCLIGEHCSLAEGVELVDTVIGDNVTIAQPVRLERCVVLSDVILDDGHDYVDAVFTVDAKLDAKLHG